MPGGGPLFRMERLGDDAGAGGRSQLDAGTVITITASHLKRTGRGLQTQGDQNNANLS
jgi:hypothetical protein